MLNVKRAIRIISLMTAFSILLMGIPALAAEEGMIFVVAPGDCLTKIIKSHYGRITSKLIAKVKESNPEIKDINLIYVGQKILLPSAHPRMAAAVTSSPSKSKEDTRLASLPPTDIKEIKEGFCYIKKMSGAVKIQRANVPVWIPVDGKQVLLQKGDKIKSGKNSWVEVTLKDGSTYRLGEHSDAEIKEISKGEAGRFRIGITLGKIWATVKRLAEGKKFEVATPAAVAGVRGTKFKVEVAKDGQTRVTVHEGVVNVKTSKEEVDVNAGYEVVAFLKGNLTDVNPLTLDLWDEWNKKRDSELIIIDRAAAEGDKDSLKIAAVKEKTSYADLVKAKEKRAVTADVTFFETLEEAKASDADRIIIPEENKEEDTLKVAAVKEKLSYTDLVKTKEKRAVTGDVTFFETLEEAKASDADRIIIPGEEGEETLKIAAVKEKVSPADLIKAEEKRAVPGEVTLFETLEEAKASDAEQIIIPKEDKGEETLKIAAVKEKISYADLVKAKEERAVTADVSFFKTLDEASASDAEQIIIPGEEKGSGSRLRILSTKEGEELKIATASPPAGMIAPLKIEKLLANVDEKGDFPPTLIIGKPLIKPLDYVTHQRTFELTGITDNNAIVTINNVPAKVENDGTFKGIVKLKKGDNKITLVATGPTGNTTIATRTVALLEDERQ
ncbi:MAG: FecR domain-containing protein [bacterium]